MTQDKVIVGISGGVDSAVASFLLKEMGFDVVGVTLLLHEGNPLNPQNCCDLTTARKVAQAISIEYHVSDVRESFEREVILPFIEAHKEGLTLNPCMDCNRVFKFQRLIDLKEQLRARFVASGHYARTVRYKGRTLLARGRDLDKDQSYFLSFLRPQDVGEVIFPLGEMAKKETRELAKRIGVFVEKKAESQELCFLSGNKVVDFLKEHLKERPGEVVNERGDIVGKHQGIFLFTIGQRRGVSLSTGQRLYVLGLDPQKNRVTVGEREKGWTREIRVGKLNWFIEPPKHFEALVQVRYRHPANPASVSMVDAGAYALVKFLEDEWAPAPGQVAAFYDEDVLLGAGMILPPGKSSKSNLS